MLQWIVVGMIVCLASPVVAAERAPAKKAPAKSVPVNIPRSFDKRIRITLFAKEPQIVTPTGIDVDHAGRVWAIESNTHFPPEGYTGHASDRVLVMQDTSGDGQADKITLFTDGLTHTMSVKVKPVWLESRESRVQSPETKGRQRHPGKSLNSRPSTLDVYLATRREIFLYHDDDGDLKADRRTRIINLETAGIYPHNGLAGITFDALGWMVFGLGENHGNDYKLTGSDGTTLTGGGEGGSVYRCRPDGSQLTRWATGFWNPHASCFDAFGRLFTVDNDPSSRPPCRLLHVIQNGDYGYRYRNGRQGLHPFTSWNGELPGTLPMVAGTGEAPSGIVAYEASGLPKDYLGDLLVTSWGDHRIDRFRLKPKGASFQSLPKTLIQGDENFRPVGLATAPDGSLYCTDWVLRDYKVHGHGRVWRISMVHPPKRTVIDTATITSKQPVGQLEKLLASPRITIRRTAAKALSKTKDGRVALLRTLGDRTQSARAQIEALWAAAMVPRKIVDFQFVMKGEEHPPHGKSKILTDHNEVYGAILRVVGTSQQFEVDHFFKSGESCTLSMDGDVDEEHPANLLATDQLRLRYPNLVAFPFPFQSVEGALRDLLKVTNDPFLQLSLMNGLARNPKAHRFLEQCRTAKSDRVRLLACLALRKSSSSDLASITIALKDPSPAVRRAAVQWVAEEHIKKLRPQVEAILNNRSRKMSSSLFLSTLAALEILDGVPPGKFDKTPASKYVLPLLTDSKRPPSVRAQALRLVDPSDSALTAKLYRNLLASNDMPLIRETVRTLDHSPLKTAADMLIPIALNKQNDISLRADAITGLTGRWFNSKDSAEVRQTLEQLMLSKQRPLQLEAVRTARTLLTKTVRGRVIRLKLLRQLKVAKQANPKRLASGGADRPLAEQLVLALSQARIALPEILKPVQADRPKTEDGWLRRVISPGGDPASGRRVFFHSQGPGCYKCHTISGRGGKIGPNLSVIASTMDRRKLAESILTPSKEIAPQFTTWAFLMDSGKVFTGMILGDTRGKIQRIGTSDGKIVVLPTDKIEERSPQSISLMPRKLVDQLTVSEFRDLLAFLETLK